MGKLRFIAGAIGIVAGFFAYQYGLFLTLNLSPELSKWSLNLLPWLDSVAVMGAGLQLAGGAVAIVGLLLCIAWVGSQPRTRQPSRETSATSTLSTQVAAPERKCKFCNTPMEPEAAFCPKCERAQA